MKKSLYPFLLFTIGLLGCEAEKSVPSHAFYFWRQGGTPNTSERVWLDSLHVKRLYIRCFDIDVHPVSGLPIPLSETTLTPDTTAEVVPVIFITERVFRQLSASGVDSLANNIVEKLSALTIGVSVSELQVDCDWTASSRSAYFRLLSVLKLRLGPKVRLSVTLRLHQWARSTETGVPPVDAVVLMCYNTGQVAALTDTNAILGVDQVEIYARRATTYPLPLDVALPVFSWARIWRDGLLVNLVHGATADELRSSINKFDEMALRVFVATTEQYWHGHYLYKGDVVRIDIVSEAALRGVVAAISAKVRPQRLIWYHLDSRNLKMYKPDNLREVAKCFVQ